MEVIRRALEHYADRLDKLQETPEIKAGNELMERDLKGIADEARDIVKKLSLDTLRSTLKDEKEIIGCALRSYVKDMKRGIDALNKALDASPTLKNTQQEMQLVWELMDAIKRL
ncbi:MAG: hypothetical protein ACRD5H_18030 [Nitrososphaerales archaeon]